MKKLLLLLTLFAVSLSITAQELDHDRYKISGGLLGAWNSDKFRIEGDNTFNVKYHYTWGYSGGIWLNFPLGNHFSIDLEAMQSFYQYNPEPAQGSRPLIIDGSVTYLQIPVLLKWYWGKSFAITAGPQFDLVTNSNVYPDEITDDSLTSSSLALNVGFEILPRNTISIFGRYIHGFTDMNNTVTNNGNAEYFNTNIQLGLKLKLFGKMIPADTDKDSIPDKDDKCPTVAGVARYMGCPIPDTDGDGINDEMDKCIDVVGLERYAGCPIPDSDKDGINDEVDKCPKVAGLAKYDGCPIPDTDGDGINDEQDKCPSKAGVAKFMGCPDTDGDGIQDSEDHCPTIAGAMDNFGCPKIESAKFTTQRIQFNTGTATLTADAKKDVMEGAKLLNSDDFKMLKIEIRGHTDNTGKADANQALSEKRAKAVLEELAKDGVSRDRMTAMGFGQTQPIADNNTKEGRAKNRRVAFDVRQ